MTTTIADDTPARVRSMVPDTACQQRPPPCDEARGAPQAGVNANNRARIATQDRDLPQMTEQVAEPPSLGRKAPDLASMNTDLAAG